jgi:hypothetical protein
LKGGADSPLLKTGFIKEDGNSAILLESGSADGIEEVSYLNVTGLEVGKKYFACCKFKPLSAGDQARVACRVSFLDADGKLISNSFSPNIPVKDLEPQDFIHSFDVPAGTVKFSLTFWFLGVQKTVVDNIAVDTSLPTSGNTDGNLMFNGSFEPSSMIEYVLGCSLDGKEYKENDGKLFVARDTLKAKSGKYALLSSSDFEKAINSIDMVALPFTSGAKYKFGVSYFIGEAEGKVRFSGRIAFLDKDGKVISRQFPSGDVTPGKWNEMKVEFFPPAGTARIMVTLWPEGKMKVWLDDIYFGEIKLKASTVRTEGAFVVAQNSDLVLWKDMPYLKPPVDGVPEGVKEGAVITLSAAANECEPFQLIVTPKKKLAS